jgi:hypothetical protein
LGSCISLGTISVDDAFLEEVVRDARVFDRGRKGDEWGGDVGVEPGEDRLNAGWDGERLVGVSEAADCDCPAIGFCIFCVEPCGESKLEGFISSSWGISSAAGMGRPLPAALS